MERREREQEEKRKAEDEQIRREIRKAITFKAQPNPFGWNDWITHSSIKPLKHQLFQKQNDLIY